MAKRTKAPLEYGISIQPAGEADGGESRIHIDGRLKTRLLRCTCFTSDTFVVENEAVPSVMSALVDAADVLSEQEGVKVSLWFTVESSYFANPSA